MTSRSCYRNDLALSQLETARALYLAGHDCASVVTLAGAADELFGKLLAAAGKESSLDSLKKAVCAIQERLYGELLEERLSPAMEKFQREALAA